MRQIILVLSLLSLVLFGRDSGACTCGPPPPVEHINDAALVFGGILESVKEHPHADGLTPGSGLAEYCFKVGQVWSGPRLRTVSVFSDRSSCGAQFEVGRYYFVCAFEIGKPDSPLRTGLCSSCRIELALVARLVLEEPVVIDQELAVPRPSEAELEVYANSEDWALAEQGAKALDVLRASESYRDR